MPKIYLIRHGRAASGWGEAADPGLSREGCEQALQASKIMQAREPMSIVSSPMARARETAKPLAEAWSCTPEIDLRFSEIPTPGEIKTNRKAWIKDTLSKHWDAMELELQEWRDDLLAAIRALNADTVVFSHFIAINAVVGEAVGNKNMVVFMPDNASITVVAVEGPAIILLEKGLEMSTPVG